MYSSNSTSIVGLYSPLNSTNTTGCNLITLTNGTVSLAPYWENIPETLILNGSIGFVLYVIFLLLTKIAWLRPHVNNSNKSEGIVSFLYGYRDPERWYVIPRFEFLKRTAKRHNHDLNCSKLYVPPKLPLSNPIELLDFESHLDDSKSNDDINVTSKSSHSPSKSKGFKTIRQDDNNNNNNTSSDQTKFKSINDSLTTPISVSPPETPKEVYKSTLSGPIEHPSNNTKSKSIKALDRSFFYPSILTDERLQASSLSRKLNWFFAKFFRVTDADIIYAKGIDAYEYLLFQRHLILIMFITNLLCIGLILPVHWFAGQNHAASGNLEFGSSFQRSTLKNMGNNSNYYWAHIVSSVLIVLVTITILNSYRDSIVTKHENLIARRTLLIGNIPIYQRNRAKMCEIFAQYFTDSRIESIQFVYNTSRLEFYRMQLDTIMVAKDYCSYYRRKYNKELMVKHSDVNEGQYCNGNCRLCSFFLVCLCYWPKETEKPGTIFYEQQELRYRDKIRKDFEKLIQEPSEYAFVTLKTHRQARRVMEKLTKLKNDTLSERYLNLWNKSQKNYGRASNNQALDANSKKTEVLISNDNSAADPLDPTNNPHVRSIRSPIIKRPASNKIAGIGSRSLDGPVAWSVRYAPHPDNVEYSDILEISKTSKYTTVLLHFLMIIIFIFFTTPNVLLSFVQRWSLLQPEATETMSGFQGIMINYISVLLQIIATAILPTLIVLISKQIPYEDTSSKNHSTMWKTYMFLVLMVIVMPSIGMNSAQALLSNKISPECLFPTDNGAYFINYVISSIFLTSILELIKPVDILSYYFILWTGRSKAEFESGRQYIEREFSVSMQHTSVLLVFSVVMTYAISCPLIAPAGLVYLIVKHAIDHYHLFYTYFTKKVDRNIQRTTEIFVRVALLLMLFQTAVALYINTGNGYFSLMSEIVFSLTLAIFLFNCFFDFTSRAMMSNKRGRHQRDFCACFYMPRVVENLLRSGAIPENCISRKV